ncbi:CPBP family intramembrane glutamic endopeptidase [Blastococcus sp. SYSU D00669]
MSSTRDIPVTAAPTIPAAPGSGVVGFIRRRPLTSYLIWFFTVGQAFAFAPVVARAYDVEVHAQLFIIASTLIGLLLPAVAITRLSDGPDGVRALWRRSLAAWVSLRWYALALAGVPLLATALAIAFFGAPTADLSTSAVLSAVVSGLVLQTVLSLVPNNWAEEVAWMGFFQARLQDRTTPMRAAALTAPVFALQHVVLVVGNSVVLAVVFMIGLILINIPVRALMGWTYNRTGSLFIVAVLHAVGNGVGGGSGFGDGFLPRLYPGADFVGLMHFPAYALIAVVVIVATRGRLGQPRRRTATQPTPIP